VLTALLLCGFTLVRQHRGYHLLAGFVSTELSGRLLESLAMAKLVKVFFRR
jgi:hypothetical protein